jgi:hypothetical protein
MCYLFENKILREMFGLLGDEVVGERIISGREFMIYSPPFLRLMR